MHYLIMGLIIIITMILVSERAKYYLHMVQLEGYKTENYKKWLKNNKEKAYALVRPEEQVKNPLAFTQRAKRLYGANLFINLFIMLIIPIIYLSLSHIVLIVFQVILGFLLYRQQADFMIIANSIMVPIENRINMGFYRSAQEKIKNRKDLKVIGITGSFGKTSTKFIVETILKEKFKVLNTPESYNTPMGLSKVINNDLEDSHEVFIAEMGARQLGEITELAELCFPSIGILTSVGPAHIETFINIDNIMKTKYELIESLPTDGVAIFNYDNEYIKKLADKTFKEKILYGFEDVENLDIYADDIVVSEKGSSFNLKDREGNSIRCITRLLGKHNIYNILAGACAARILGLSFEEISKGISNVAPIPHRLNIIDSGSGVIVIDDTFNSNPIGTKAALEVISQFKEGKKIVVTPGMIELGDMEEEANREFGRNMGKVCDYVILVGKKRTQPIYDGLIETSFNPQNIFVVSNLDEANVHIGKLAKPKDVVLFENDLPN